MTAGTECALVLSGAGDVVVVRFSAVSPRASLKARHILIMAEYQISSVPRFSSKLYIPCRCWRTDFVIHVQVTWDLGEAEGLV